MKFCCNLIERSFNDKHVPLAYYEQIRRYAFIILKRKMLEKMFFCPWCGKQFPKDLYDEFYEIITKQLNLTPSESIIKTPKLPDEFKTDEWWRKRQL